MPTTDATPDASPADPESPTQRRVRLTLRIDGTDYRVRPVAREDLAAADVEAFTLTRDDAKLGRVRDTIAMTCDGFRCSCEDRTYRPTADGCKHLRAALAVGLL